MSSRWDVVIIGAGISSLTCAALLARKGRSVCVLEAHAKPGGYLHCFSRFGNRFDTGAHYVGAMGEGQPFRVLLEYLNVFDERIFVPLREDGFDILRFPSFEVKLPRGYERLVDELSERFPAERGAIRSYFERVREIVRLFPTYEFNDSFEEAGTPELLDALETSLATVVRRLTVDPALQCVLFAPCTLHGVAPEDVSFGLHAIMMDSLVRGAYGLRQGGDALASSFVAEIEASGGQVLTRKRVNRLEVEGRSIRAVHAQDGSRYEGDWVISGIHPKATYRLLSDQSVFSPAFRERLERIRESVAMLGVYASCTPGVDLDPLRNYYFFDSEDAGTFLAPRGPDRAGCVFAASSARQGEAGARSHPINLHSAAPVEWFGPWQGSRYRSRPSEYESLKNRCAESALGLVEHYRPGFRAGILRYETSTPLSNLHFNGSEEGSAYGLYHSIENTGARALGPRTKILNLLLTGQNCLFPGLLGAGASSLRTAGHIIGVKPILKDLKERLRSV